MTYTSLTPDGQKAIEFAEYMAKAAENYMDAEDNMARGCDDEGPAEDWDLLDRVVDARRALMSAIYEFRKRTTKI